MAHLLAVQQLFKKSIAVSTPTALSNMVCSYKHVPEEHVLCALFTVQQNILVQLRVSLIRSN